MYWMQVTIHLGICINMCIISEIALLNQAYERHLSGWIVPAYCCWRKLEVKGYM
jgi:hypothetical protein